MQTLRRLFTAIALFFGLALGLSACSGITLPSDDGPVKVEKNGDDGVDITTDEGSVSTGSKLPDKFPSEVPLIDGKIVYATSVSTTDGDMFSVTIEVKDDPQSAMDEASSDLEDAGFAKTESMDLNGYLAAGFSSDAWNVNLASTSDNGSVSNVQYTVMSAATS